MWIISATMYVSLALIFFLLLFIGKYFMYFYYFPLLLCALIALSLGLVTYWFGLKKMK